jgi:hypothetical protein
MIFFKYSERLKPTTIQESTTPRCGCERVVVLDEEIGTGCKYVESLKRAEMKMGRAGDDDR